MKLFFALAAIIFAAFQPGFAQRSERPGKNEARETRRGIIREIRQEAASFKGGGAVSEAAPSAADVGEPDSFNKNAKFMGISGGGVIYVYSSCDPAVLSTDLGVVLGPDDRCLAVGDGSVTTFQTFTDLGRINLPAKANDNILYMINNHTINYQFENLTAANVSGQMSYSPLVTIESVALNDPAAIDPSTGLPMNGSFTTGGNGTTTVSQLLFPNSFETHVQSYSRANTAGFSRVFWAALGLPQNVIDQLYKKPMTIRLGARVSARRVPFGLFLYTARFLGN